METPVAIVGGGAAGLSVAAMLRAQGVGSVVLEAEAELGRPWRGRYDRLHLHTPRGFSHLPGYPIPRAYGRWLPRDRVVAYLQEYARHHELDVRLGRPARRIERDGDGWLVHADG